MRHVMQSTPLLDPSPVASSDRAGEGEVAPRYQRRDRREHLIAAMQRLGVEQQDIAIDWSCHHSYAGAVLRGEKPWTAEVEKKLALLPEELQIAVLEEQCKDFGIVTGSAAALLGVLEVLLTTLQREQRTLPTRTQRQVRMDLDQQTVRTA